MMTCDRIRMCYLLTLIVVDLFI